MRRCFFIIRRWVIRMKAGQINCINFVFWFHGSEKYVIINTGSGLCRSPYSGLREGGVRMPAGLSAGYASAPAVL